MSENIHIRPLATHEELSACVELQKTTWGAKFDDVVSAALMAISQKIGGIAAGAFAPDDDLLGIVFGLTGIREGLLVHWSHMLAVKPGHHGRGLGALLKFYQAERAAKLGISRMYWTFDPLEARNAHFNLNRLRAGIEEYVVDLYGPGETSPLHRGIGTDRFVVLWEIDSERVRKLRESARASIRIESDKALATLPFRIDDRDEIVPEKMPGAGLEAPIADESRAYVEIPPDIQSLKASRPDEARNWRTLTRAAFTHYLSKGYRVNSFLRYPGRCFYVLERRP